VDLNGSAGRQFSEIGEVVGEEAVGNSIDAEFEVIAIGRGGDGVGAGLLLAVGISGYGGDELAGVEGEGFQILKNKIEVVALGRFRDARPACQTSRVRFTRQGKSLTCDKDEARRAMTKVGVSKNFSLRG
jgi:hypothetical protein